MVLNKNCHAFPHQLERCSFREDKVSPFQHWHLTVFLSCWRIDWNKLETNVDTFEENLQDNRINGNSCWTHNLLIWTIIPVQLISVGYSHWLCSFLFHITIQTLTCNYRQLNRVITSWLFFGFWSLSLRPVCQILNITIELTVTLSDSSDWIYSSASVFRTGIFIN